MMAFRQYSKRNGPIGSAKRQLHFLTAVLPSCSEQRYKIFELTFPRQSALKTDTASCAETFLQLCPVPTSVYPAQYNLPYHRAHSREALLFQLLSTDQPKGQSSQIFITPHPTLYGQLTITSKLIPHSAGGYFVCCFKDLIQLLGLFLAYSPVTMGSTKE